MKNKINKKYKESIFTQIIYIQLHNIIQPKINLNKLAKEIMKEGNHQIN